VHWKELESDIELGALFDAFRELDYLSVIRATANLSHGVRIYALRSCVETVMSHVRSNKKEVGGLLLGQVWQYDVHAWNPGGALTILVEAVPSTDYRNSSVSLEMGTGVWCRINERVSAGRIVVGWYHSHPNLGAFFSETDRRTQRAFFNNHYSLGWVIDPFRDEQKVFSGGNSEEYRHTILEIDYELEIAKSH
jgi:proteasome lid subunit RPN8/RPN11